MTHPINEKIEGFAEYYRKALDSHLLKEGITQAEATKKAMLGKSHELPINVYTNMCYLDAYARIVNIENYSPVDKIDWELKHYVDSLVEGLYRWAYNNPGFLPTLKESGAVQQVPPLTDDELYQTITLLAVKRIEDKSDEFTKVTEDGATT